MRIAVMSDLHLERDEKVARATTAAVRGEHPRSGPDLRSLHAIDLAVLAGDIWSAVKAIARADEMASYLGCPAVVIAGNHEFYRQDITVARAEMARAAERTEGRVRFLDDARADFTIKGDRVAVLGATLWTDYGLLDRNNRAGAMTEAGLRLSDHRAISLDGRAFQPADALALHQRSREWLNAAVPAAVSEVDLVIVATHHGVSPVANAPEHAGDAVSPAFVSDLEDEIRRWEADLVVSGHTHHPFDAMIGKTRVTSSPRGYPGIDSGAERYVPAVIELIPRRRHGLYRTLKSALHGWTR